jgi:hypothetical protein
MKLRTFNYYRTVTACSKFSKFSKGSKSILELLELRERAPIIGRVLYSKI